MKPSRHSRARGHAAAAERRAARPGSDAEPPAGVAEPHAQPRAELTWLYAAGLLLAVLFAYQPAWHGGLLWDDSGHVTRADLRNWHGLFRIWFEPGATQQYYPLLHSAFWLEHRLWGDDTLGYHLVNILLHGTSAVLVGIILRRLAVPGAWLAAAIFALHPVQVESVAWITEQKNTLAGVLYLAAMLTYLRYDRERRVAVYLGALALFVLGLLSKSVTATLPAALLVIFWWQRGRLSWRRDVLPLLPMFVLAAAAGCFTAWVERNFIGATGAAFELTLVERGLIAGRATWFYLAKLAWPADLIFIYPRWSINSAVWWQYLFPLAAMLLVAGAWALRRRARGPLAALLFFGGTLFPALGFVSVFPFLYSFVADHFQYLASLGIITLASAACASLLARRQPWGRASGIALCLGLLALLMGLTRRQSRGYGDIETLYLTTLERNPACWMAHNNLGNALVARGGIDDAITHFRRALELKPDYAEAHNNLGNIAADRGHLDEAIACYRQSLAIDPDYVNAHNNLGNALARRGDIDEAIVHFRKALQGRKDFAGAYVNLGNALASRQQFDEAIANYQKAVDISPDYAEAHNFLGLALVGSGRLAAAIIHYRAALDIQPVWAEAHSNLGNALAWRGQFDEAIAHYRRALEINPDYPEARRNLDLVLAERERPHPKP